MTLLYLILLILRSLVINPLMLQLIGVARDGHGRANALPSLDFALPSKPSFYLKCI